MPRAKKRSAKGSNFKEYDRALPLLELLLYGLSRKENARVCVGKQAVAAAA